MENTAYANNQTGYQPRGSRWPMVILLVVVIVILALLGYFFRDKFGASSGSTYEAVFLTNGQVYFGHMSSSKGYVTLNDIYYLQVNQPLQSGQSQASQTQPQLSLVKLGNELHGPQDLMFINPTQVLFYEDLKSDGKVVQAIQAYKKNPTPPTGGTGAPATTNPAGQNPAGGAAANTQLQTPTIPGANTPAGK